MSKTPVCDFLQNYRSQKLRFHMPAHKGKGQIERDDITEIDGADVLYAPNGIIKQSEEVASEIFGSKKTFYSTEGSSLCIRAAVWLVAAYCKSVGKKTAVVAARNVHSSFVSACALSDVEPVWLYGEGDVLSPKISLDEVERALKTQNPAAVYLTSPDYLGNIADVKAVSELCRKYGALLVVDNAHGSYLRFLEKDLHPLSAGADVCIESAHKTLPCLTGTAYLHFGKNVPEFFENNANFALSLFASTSPSYLLISSLDRFNGRAEKYGADVRRVAKTVLKMKSEIENAGYELVGEEPLKITVKTKSYGYYGFEIAEILRNNDIHVEFFDRDYLTFMISPKNSRHDLCELEAALLAIPKKTAITETPPTAKRGERAITVREAVFSTFQETDVSNSEGKILAGLTVSCPPAVPPVLCGERITKEAVRVLKYYNVEKIKTVKE